MLPALPAFAALLLARRTDARVARVGAEAAPDEPCWTETIASGSRHSHGRSHCLNDELMEMDARARSGDFPIPGQGRGALPLHRRA